MRRPRLAFLGACGLLLAVAGYAAAAPPTLTAVKPAADGYTLVGTGFGAGKGKTEVFEGAARVAADRIVSITPSAIVVRGKPSGAVQHKVVIDGQPTAVVTFTHDGARPQPRVSEGPGPKAPAAAARGAQTGPRTLRLTMLQATGYRQAAPATRALTLGTLNATGYRAEAPPARTLTLGTLSAEGYRE